MRTSPVTTSSARCVTLGRGQPSRERTMAANSLPRRIAKRLFAPALGEGTYSLLQAVAMGWDIRTGNWHEPELELLTVGLRPGETAVDVGGNYGLYAYHMSRAV